METVKKTAWRAAAITALVVTFAAGAQAMISFHRAKRPAASEFGLGPRTSIAGRYTATLQPEQPLRVRKLQTVIVSIRDANGQPVEAAAITVDGGMPQHGHGLPTRPRVTKNLGGGTYEISGVRFNMGGWWEFKLTITDDAGADTLTFNLSL